MLLIMLSNISIDIGGNCSILFFSVLIPVSMSSAKLNSYHKRKFAYISIIKIVVKEELRPTN